MEELKKYSKTELLHFINDAKKQHEEKKMELKNLLDEVKVIDNKINESIEDLDSIESMYVKLMEEYTDRD